jgi:hypothetical protein
MLLGDERARAAADGLQREPCLGGRKEALLSLEEHLLTVSGVSHEGQRPLLTAQLPLRAEVGGVAQRRIRGDEGQGRLCRAAPSAQRYSHQGQAQMHGPGEPRGRGRRGKGHGRAQCSHGAPHFPPPLGNSSSRAAR